MSETASGWAIEPLRADHVCSAFTCGSNWLDQYLRRHAIRNQVRGYGRTYVYARADGSNIADGYYTVSMSSVQFQNLPDALQFSNMPKYPMPAAHLGCLAVATAIHRQGHGGILLVDALRRMLAGADIVGARAVEVKAIDDAARDWYAGYGFLPFKDASGPPYHLFLPMDTAEQIVRASE